MSLHVSGGPHIRTRSTTQKVMLDVLIALVPTTVAGIYLFSWPALWLLVVSVISAVASEYIWQKLAKKEVVINDLSAVVTGLLLGLNLPANVPLWVAAIGSAFAIIVVKQLFGGIGHNFLNPALAARAVLLTSWPAHMASAVLPSRLIGVSQAAFSVDAMSTATPLKMPTEWGMYDLIMGNIPGTIGEVCKVALVIGFIYLLVRKVIGWHIPVIFVATSMLMTYALGEDGLFAIMSGGILLGAIFMATDYVSNPMLKRAQAVFAVGCGVVVVLIRQFGSYPEGVTYAILIMNILSPFFDRMIRRRIYGRAKKHGKKRG